MALKKAKIFKDFIISTDENNIGVVFRMRDALDVSVKNDNFATSVLIKSENVDFFAYRYITFDGSAVFEITDVVKNDKYYSLSVRYISNIIFSDDDGADVPDPDFYVDGVSAYTLQRFGVDLATFLAVLGKDAKREIVDVREIADERQKPFLYAVKVRLSECPQNLSDVFDLNAQGNILRIVGKGKTGKDLADKNFAYISAKKVSNSNAISGYAFQQFDSAFSCLLIIPPYPTTYIGAKNLTDNTISEYHTNNITIGDFLARLNLLITDLTISAELCIVPIDHIVTFTGVNAYSEPLEIVDADDVPDYAARPARVLLVPYHEQDARPSGTNTHWADAWRDFTSGVDITKSYPLFCIQLYTLPDTMAPDRFYGISEILAPFDVYINDLADPSTVVASVRILGNEISLKDCRNDYITIWRRAQKMRIFTDFDRGVYTDIETTFEFTRDAYSNYEAYKKANIDLVQRQQTASLEQQQEQQRKQFIVNQIFATYEGVRDTITDTGSELLNGDFGAAAKAAARGIENVLLRGAKAGILQKMSRQNAEANLRLAQEQAHEQARETIVNAGDLGGSLQYTEAFISDTYDAMRPQDVYPYSLFTLSRLVASDIDMRRLERYAFDMDVIDKVRDAADVVRPAWQYMHSFFQMRIKNKNPLNNKKDMIVFADGGAFAFKAAQAVFGAGQNGLPVVEPDTGFVGHLSENPQATLTFNITAAEAGKAEIVAYVTGRKQGARPFSAGWYTYINDVYERINAIIPQGEYETEWLKSYPVTLGAFDLNAGKNTIVFRVSDTVGMYGASNFDKIELRMLDRNGGYKWTIITNNENNE